LTRRHAAGLAPRPRRGRAHNAGAARSRWACLVVITTHDTTTMPGTSGRTITLGNLGDRPRGCPRATVPDGRVRLDLDAEGARQELRRDPHLDLDRRGEPTRSGPVRSAATPHATAQATPAARPGPLHPTRQATAATAQKTPQEPAPARRASGPPDAWRPPWAPPWPLPRAIRTRVRSLILGGDASDGGCRPGPPALITPASGRPLVNGREGPRCVLRGSRRRGRAASTREGGRRGRRRRGPDIGRGMPNRPSGRAGPYLDSQDIGRGPRGRD
jgi:hypothetical protein